MCAQEIKKLKFIKPKIFHLNVIHPLTNIFYFKFVKYSVVEKNLLTSVLDCGHPLTRCLTAVRLST